MLQLVTPAQAFDNWLSLRDAGVVRQERDFSCGAAALATVLTHYYGEPVSEAALLEQLLRERVNTGDTKVQQQALSFADLAMLAGSRHYPSMGLAVAFEDLKKLKLPVIVALVIEGRGHFSVLRRVDSDDRVFLADPSWGNRQLGKQAFLRSFSTPGTSAQGRILIIGSKRDSKNGSKSGSGGDERFRHRTPRRALMAPGV
ncbi:C39 family peptidase [Congregibacter litoralis]|uniref:C39 family peptidase n=1 Tax=Congregibacter litoralis TaxID=393662 RepID=UPI00006B92B7|nr:cysteine peptidase family C39 domain-containing protein [Congregibacter litoralis]